MLLSYVVILCSADIAALGTDRAVAQAGTGNRACRSWNTVLFWVNFYLFMVLVIIYTVTVVIHVH